MHLVEVEDDHQELHGDETIIATFSACDLGHRMANACRTMANTTAIVIAVPDALPGHQGVDRLLKHLKVTELRAKIDRRNDALRHEVLDAAIDKMGWPEINAFYGELARGQDITEDAGGFVMRSIRRLFGLPSNKPTVQTYQDAARAMVHAAGSVA